jgi:transcriptional regulator with XRE-family HTH domain
MGVDEQRISKRVSGRVPFSADEIVQVARFLGVTVEDLAGGPANEQLSIPTQTSAGAA